MLCSLITHIGVFKVKRLPFGIKVASAIKTNVVVYQDDKTVTGKDISSHINNLRAVLNKLNLAGLSSNYSKCNFFKMKFIIWVFFIDMSGLKSIINAPLRKNVSEFRAFIGLSNYYSRFISSFSDT